MDHKCPICGGLLIFDQDTKDYECGVCFKEFSETELQECEDLFTSREKVWSPLL